MAFCTNCGNELDGAEYCTNCGTKNPPSDEFDGVFQAETESVQPENVAPEPIQQIDSKPQPEPRQAAQPVYTPPVYTPPVYTPPPYVPPKKPEGFITTGGWLGILLLTMIPFVGLVFLIVWACGGCAKRQKTTYARAMLIVRITLLLLLVIAALVIFMFFPYAYTGYWTDSGFYTYGHDGWRHVGMILSNVISLFR